MIVPVDREELLVGAIATLSSEIHILNRHGRRVWKSYIVDERCFEEDSVDTTGPDGIMVILAMIEHDWVYALNAQGVGWR